MPLLFASCPNLATEAGACSSTCCRPTMLNCAATPPLPTCPEPIISAISAPAWRRRCARPPRPQPGSCPSSQTPQRCRLRPRTAPGFYVGMQQKGQQHNVRGEQVLEDQSSKRCEESHTAVTDRADYNLQTACIPHPATKRLLLISSQALPWAMHASPLYRLPSPLPTHPTPPPPCNSLEVSKLAQVPQLDAVF